MALMHSSESHLSSSSSHSQKFACSSASMFILDVVPALISEGTTNRRGRENLERERVNAMGVDWTERNRDQEKEFFWLLYNKEVLWRLVVCYCSYCWTANSKLSGILCWFDLPSASSMPPLQHISKLTSLIYLHVHDFNNKCSLAGQFSIHLGTAAGVPKQWILFQM